LPKCLHNELLLLS